MVGKVESASMREPNGLIDLMNSGGRPTHGGAVLIRKMGKKR